MHSLKAQRNAKPGSQSEGAPETHTQFKSCGLISACLAVRTRGVFSAESLGILGMILLALALLYCAAGLVTALAFVTVGVSQVFVPPAPITLGARILLVPGAATLWPYVLIRWVRCRRPR
jgi:hypothetical protein